NHFFLYHRFDLRHFGPDEKHVGKLDRVCDSHRLDDQIARTEAENPVAEHVGTLLLHDHAGGVIHRLLAAYLRAYADLARREDKVRLSIEEYEIDEPEDEQHRRDEQVPTHVDVDRELIEPMEDNLPPARGGENEREHDDGH